MTEVVLEEQCLTKVRLVNPESRRDALIGAVVRVNGGEWKAQTYRLKLARDGFKTREGAVRALIRLYRDELNQLLSATSDEFLRNRQLVEGVGDGD
jgi:predicted esterase YcpF (UPF0227 family)